MFRVARREKGWSRAPSRMGYGRRVKRSGWRLALWGCVLGCSARFWPAASGTYACEAMVTEDTCGGARGATSREVTVSGGGTDVISLMAPAAGSIRASGPWGSVQFGAQADPEVYRSTGGMDCEGTWVAFSQRAVLTEVATGRVALTVAYDYGDRAAACGGAAGCRLAYAVTCARVR